jgi:hypothetical protein
VKDGKVPVSLFTKTLQSIQDVVYQLADERARRESRSGRSKASFVKRECELFLVDVAPGSLHATLALPEKDPALFPQFPEFCNLVMAEAVEALDAIAAGKADRVREVIPDPVVRKRVMARVNRIAPGKDSDYSLSFSFNGGPAKSLLRPSEDFIALLSDIPQGPPEVREPDIRYVEAKGRAEVKNGDIKKWVETFEMSEMDVDPEHVWRSGVLRAKGRVFHLVHPVACVIEREEDLFFSEDDYLGIVAHGDSREAVIREFSDEFAALWDGIAQEEDGKLTQDAQSLKKRLLGLVRKMETHERPEIAGDQRGSY